MSQPIRRTASAAARTVSGAVALGLCLVLGLTACSGDDEEPDAGPGPVESSAAAPEEESVVTDLGFGAIEGRLPQAARDELAGQVQPVIDGWIDAAYLGDYPRTDFSTAWAAFTPGARKQAEQDAALMSNSDIGAEVEGVEAESRRVRLDVLSVRQRPRGVTAHVVLRLTTTGPTEQEVRVRGRLYLTQGKQGWQVFGYDLGKVVL